MIPTTPMPTKWVRLSEMLASAIGPNDEYPSPAQIAKHRAAQLAHDATQPNLMQHLHVGDIVALILSVEFVTSFELVPGLIVRFGERERSPFWLIDRPHSLAALFDASGSMSHAVSPPFELGHFMTKSADETSEIINESTVTGTCDLGDGIALRVGTRDGAPIYVLYNDQTGSLCAVWYHDNRLR